MTALHGVIPGALSAPPRQATHTGADAAAHRVLGLHRRRLRATPLLAEAREVLGVARTMADLDEQGVMERRESLRNAVRRRSRDAMIVRQGFALAVECIRRHTGFTLHPEQVAAALAMERGAIAELATGEGKTLAAVLPATLAAWRGRGCHVVTANDYLARRDAEANAPIFAPLGITVGSIVGGDAPPARASAYGRDITYTTARELAADFLRDRLALAPRVQRPLAQAIIDEADFVLIDDAATPLILASSARGRDETAAIRLADRAARTLTPDRHFSIDAPRREARLRDSASPVIDACFGDDPTPIRRRRELVIAALRAHHLFHRDIDYAISADRVVIIDERTGRISPDRRWRDGLHEAIEAREGVAINAADDTLASISFQRYFCQYPRLSGMTGTARECAGEFWGVYWMPTALIPPHRAVRRRHLPPRSFADAGEAIHAAAHEARAMRDAGRPVLIGTTSVRDSERVREAMESIGVACRVLNAVRHAEEAEIIAQAGRAGAVTIATTMAGRGTDIMLDDQARRAGGLHVIAIGHHPSRRLDRQLFGRAGRQGDPGSARVVRSRRDDLLTRHAPAWARVLPARVRFGVVQSLAERRARRDRRAVMRRDHTLDDLLAFAAG